jgi:hypothetical protein
MAGWLTNGFQNLATVYGGEKFPLDTSLPNGQNPQSAKFSLQSLAAAVQLLTNNTPKTMVASTRYYSSVDVNAPNPAAADGGADQLAPVATITGIQFLVGTTGGTDKWIAELHDVNGVLVATSALAGATAGTAGTWQQIAFTSTVDLVPGTYFLTLQSNGTTATFAAYNFPAPVATTAQLVTGSVAGTFGTSANFTPATTYTAALGPTALLY